MELTSSAFANGSRIPTKYTGDGEDLSPPLAWSNAPEGTKEFALICDDPDAPTPQPWVHWIIYGIPPATKELSEGTSSKQASSFVQGLNSWPTGKTTGYRGPAPPPGHGIHHYHFYLYALDQALSLPPRLDKAGLLKAIRGHILAETEAIGTYGRK